MRLNHFIVMLTLAYVLLVSSVFYIYRTQVVYPQLVEYTLSKHQGDIEALRRVFLAEKEHLRLLLVDWAKWDDLYWFVEEPNDEFSDSNLMPETFIEANLSGAYISRLDQSLVFGLEHPYQADYTLYVEENSANYQRLLNIEYPEDDESYCGYMPLASVLTLYCVATSQDSNEEQDGNGYLIFTRQAGREFIDQIQVITNTHFNIVSPKKSPVNGLSFLNVSDINQPQASYFFSIPNNNENSQVIIELLYDPDELPKRIDNQTYFLILGLMFIPVMMFIGMRYFLIKPLINMSNFILNIKLEKEMPNRKDFDFIFEIKILYDAIGELMSHVKNENKHFETLSLTDALTGINNRRAFDQDIVRLWQSSSRHQKPILIMFADIDYFKYYNDTLGHPMGDEAIKEIASALHGVCRRAEDNVYRYGGEEFAMTMVLDSPDSIKDILNAVLTSVSKLNFPHPSSPISKNITISLGACLIEKPDAWMRDFSQKKAIKIADDALYKAKESGRNQFIYNTLTAAN